MTNTQHVTVVNRHGLKLDIALENLEGSKGIVFVVHGLSGSKDELHIQVVRKVFAAAGYRVVAIDTSHSFNDSEGELINATVTSYIEDLEDVIAWSEQQPWFDDRPFVIAGHSLGGITQIMYAAQHPEKVKALVPLGTVISGKVWRDNTDEPFLSEWKQKGYFEKVSESRGRSGRISWNLLEDMQQYDTLAVAGDITCPVLLVAGSEEPKALAESFQRQLLDALGGPKELHIIDGMPHVPGQQHLDRLRAILNDWVSRL